jgi:hypothetical protein
VWGDLSTEAVRSRWAALVSTKLCAVWSCPEPAAPRHRGLCKLHYRRWRRLAWRRSNGLTTRRLDVTEAELEALGEN